MPLSMRELRLLDEQANAELAAMMGGDGGGGGRAMTAEQELAAMMGGGREMTAEEELAAMCDESPEEELASITEQLAPLIASSKAAKAKGAATIAAWKREHMARYSELSKRKKALMASAAAEAPPAYAAPAATPTPEARLAAAEAELAPLVAAGRAAKGQGAPAVRAWQQQSGQRYTELRGQINALRAQVAQRAAAAAAGGERKTTTRRRRRQTA